MNKVKRMRDLLPHDAREKLRQIIVQAESFLPACDDYQRMGLPIDEWRQRLEGIIQKAQEGINVIDGGG